MSVQAIHSGIRSLSGSFIEALDKLAEDEKNGAWWRDVLARNDLILAVRRESLNVYYRGASIYRIGFIGRRVVPETHIKYLVRNKQTYVPLNAQSQFLVDANDLVQTAYEPGKTLSAMINATKGYESVEKAGLHPLILASPNVIDVELSLTRALDTTGAGEDEPILPDPFEKGSRPQDRLDVVSLEPAEDGSAIVAFHEAKAFSNPELRSWDDGAPSIVRQVERYNRTILHHQEMLRSSYREVCRALVSLDAMRRRVRTAVSVKSTSLSPNLDPLIAQVARGEIDLRLDPQVRLVVFGFDADQRDGALSRILSDLPDDLLVYAVGNPKGGKVSAAFRKRERIVPASLPLTPAVEKTPEPDRPGQAQLTKIFVYYRTRPDKPEASSEALVEQQEAVTAWCQANNAVVLGNYTEAEDEGSSRPSLATAMAACKQHYATLLVASTEPIGSGDPFSPRILSIPVVVMDHAPKLAGSTIPLSPKAPGDVCLYFRERDNSSKVPVYLCNPGPSVMTGITVSSVGATADISTSVSEKTFAALPPGTCLLVEYYDLMWDGDFITEYQVTYENEDAEPVRRTVQAVIDKGGPKHPWIKLSPVPKL